MAPSTTTAPPIRAHAAPGSPVVLRHRRAVARWALASGRPVHRDALAAIIGARADSLSAPADLDGPTAWVGEQIGELLWGDISSWCGERSARVPEPDDIARTLHTYLRYLSAHRLLAAGSDPVTLLRRAIADYGGDRGRRRHPSTGRRVAPVV
ncbi:MAG: hypothetical protein EKK62_15775, partial [Acidimicrobiia bacterium]